MFIIKRLSRAGILVAAIAAALLGGAQAASAAPGQVVHQDVTGAVLTCNDGSTYTVLSGKAMFLFHASGGFQFTDTEYFNILASAGGVVDTVRTTSHITVLPDGTVVSEFAFDKGTCHTPED